MTTPISTPIWEVEAPNQIDNTSPSVNQSGPALSSLHSLPAPFIPQVLPCENALTACVPSVLSDERTKNILRFRGVPKLESLKNHTAEEKIAALAYLPYAYNPPTNARRFAQKVTAQVRASLSLRDPENPRYAKFFYGQADVIRGGRLKAMPHFLESLQGAGFVLAGPSGAGKTALIQRLRTLIGQQHTLIQGKGSGPAELIFLPMVVIRWPNCGTLQGLLANLREALIGELGSAATNDDAFANFGGRNGSNAAIATCIFVNLGLLVLDDCCFHSMRGEYREILGFISTLQKYSGIPTILSCTYPAQQIVARGGGNGANQASAHAEYLDLLPPGKMWDSYCGFFWKLGLSEPEVSVPDYLPSLMWKSTRGNMRILAQGFSGILQALIDRPELLSTGSLQESDAAEILNHRLRIFAEPLKVIELFQKDNEVPESDLWVHGDYLPFEAFKNTPSGTFEKKFKESSLLGRKSQAIRQVTP